MLKIVHVKEVGDSKTKCTLSKAKIVSKHVTKILKKIHL